MHVLYVLVYRLRVLVDVAHTQGNFPLQTLGALADFAVQQQCYSTENRQASPATRNAESA